MYTYFHFYYWYLVKCFNLLSEVLYRTNYEWVLKCWFLMLRELAWALEPGRVPTTEGRQTSALGWAGLHLDDPGQVGPLSGPPTPVPPVTTGLAGPLTASSCLCHSTCLDGAGEASALLVRSRCRQLCGFSGDVSFECSSSLQIQSPCQHHGSASPRATGDSHPERKTSSSRQS